MATHAPARERLTLLGLPPRGADSRAGAVRRFGYLMVAPAVILLLAVTAYPLISNLWDSFHFDNLSYGSLPHKFVAGQNYTKMFSSGEWIAALERTLVFTAVTIVFDVVVGLGLALMMHRKFRGRAFLRASVLIPWAVPTVVSAMLWKTMFDPRAGFVDYFLGPFPPAWPRITCLNATACRSWGVIFVADSWKNNPFVAVILLARLQIIPNEVYEGARIARASAWQAFRRVTLPMLR